MTDHRIGLTVNNIDSVMGANNTVLERIVRQLVEEDDRQRLDAFLRKLNQPK